MVSACLAVEGILGLVFCEMNFVVICWESLLVFVDYRLPMLDIDR